MAKNLKRAIKASEISSFLYCRRAWWYTLKGVKPQNEHRMIAGNEVHHQHGVKVFLSGILRLVAYILILVALGLFTLSLAHYLV